MSRRLAALFSLLLLARCALGDDTTSALINQALDKPAKLTLNHLLPQAMEKIQKYGKRSPNLIANAGTWSKRRFAHPPTGSLPS